MSNSIIYLSLCMWRRYNCKMVDNNYFWRQEWWESSVERDIPLPFEFHSILLMAAKDKMANIMATILCITDALHYVILMSINAECSILSTATPIPPFPFRPWEGSNILPRSRPMTLLLIIIEILLNNTSSFVSSHVCIN